MRITPSVRLTVGQCAVSMLGLLAVPARRIVNVLHLSASGRAQVAFPTILYLVRRQQARSGAVDASRRAARRGRMQRLYSGGPVSLQTDPGPRAHRQIR